jgi:hypothetical protein
MKRLAHIILIKVNRLNLKLPTARLMTFAAARGFTEYLVAHQTAPRLGDALRTVNKTLDLNR